MQKKPAFAALDKHAQQFPSAFDIYQDGNYCCTTVGEFLIDHCNVSEEDAYEWAFEWVESKGK